MGDVVASTRNVSPLPGATVVNKVATASGKIGDAVYVNADWGVRPADASVEGTADGIGVVSAVNCEGIDTFEAGDAVSVVVHGPVSGFSAAAPGPAFVSDTTGAVSDEAGTVERILGRFDEPEILFVDPVVTAPAGA